MIINPYKGLDYPSSNPFDDFENQGELILEDDVNDCEEDDYSEGYAE